MTRFANRVQHWYGEHGRKDLPWQAQRTPYRVWVSEIMLQQTQVGTVIPYYQRFMQRLPNVESLARADIDQVLHLWTGLGYYARARNLHACAQQVVTDFNGKFPECVEQLSQLPGIGRSTAGAIAALSMDIRAPILDGNVKRVLTRYFAIEGWPEQSAVKKQLWEKAETLLPNEQVAEYTQAMMDLGSLICTRSKPACSNCPLKRGCKAKSQHRIAEFPGRKPSKTLPTRTTAMYIVENDKGEVLLEKRPPQGIWGSLYSLPETQPPGTQVESEVTLERIRHSFSHYHLDIQPIRLRVNRMDTGVADSNRWLWYPLDHSREVGLAAPVKKLLSQLSEDTP